MDARHERLHLDCAQGTNWQENMYFCGFDQSRNGFAVHLKLIPSGRQAQIRGVVTIDGTQYTFGARHPIATEVAYPEFRAHNHDPFRQWELELNGVGCSTESTAGYVGLEVDGPGQKVLPISALITLRTALPPIDWSQLTSDSGAGSGHYDHAHNWNGVLRVGNDTVRTNGLGIRDHSWGPRSLADVERAVFFSTVSSDLSLHQSGVVGQGAGGEFGFGFSATQSSFTVLPMPTIEVIDGSFDDADIRRVRILNDGREITVVTHTDIRMPLLRDSYLSRDLIGDIDQSGGFSFVECGTGLSAKAVAGIREEATALS
ncbi:DUF7065 domain-containing protein [Mycolicibacterium sp. XJ1819]